MERATEALGEVTVPSGTLVVLDCGLLGLWSHDRPPVFPEGDVLSPETTASANAGTDFEVIGPDAERAGLLFDRQAHPLFVYDIPRHGAGAIVAMFGQTIEKAGLSAELRALDRRVPHRERVDQALAYWGGVGEVFFHGITGGVIAGLPRDRPLPVRGVRMNRGDFPDCWDYVEVCLREGSSASRVDQIATVAVDRARIMFADVDALGAWQHEEPHDGRADYVFWGRDAEELAGVVGAPSLGDGTFGWLGRPVHEAADLGAEAERVKDERGLRLAGDFRPHSHHYEILARMRASPTQSGTLEVGGAALCALFTSWGDGFFPVFAVFDGDELSAVRVVLATDAALDAMRAVNP